MYTVRKHSIFQTNRRSFLVFTTLDFVFLDHLMPIFIPLLVSIGTIRSIDTRQFSMWAYLCCFSRLLLAVCCMWIASTTSLSSGTHIAMASVLVRVLIAWLSLSSIPIDRCPRRLPCRTEWRNVTPCQNISCGSESFFNSPNLSCRCGERCKLLQIEFEKGANLENAQIKTCLSSRRVGHH